MRLILPKDVCDAQDIYAPYMIYSEEEHKMVLREGTPQEIRELCKKNHERIEKLEEEWRRENW